ncbi:MAG: OmpA family protein [Urechidicola sp.]|nr:OmpA family protein [Urechidicola sp.]
MKKIYILFLLVAFSTSFVNAQNNKTKKADDLYARLAYTEAAEAYHKLLEKGDGDRYVFEQLGNCYYYINDTKNSETYYKRVVKGKEPKAETVYNYAQSLKANGKYGDYNTWMKKFAEMQPNDSRAIAFMENPDYIPAMLGQKEKFKLTNLEDLNTKYSEFGGIIVGSDFYFTSARNTKRKKYGWDEQPFLDIYRASVTGGTVKDASLVGGDISSKYHEGNVAITADGKRMYFDSNDYLKGKYAKSEEGINQINLYYAELVDGQWKGVQSASFNSSEYSTGHPALSPDGKTLYFVSDMPGGIGMSDIYKAAINEDGSLGAPELLGAEINTEGKEVFPYMDSNGSLFFSSDGHLGLGGLDVFYAEANGNGLEKVRSMGAGINSSNDDFAVKYDAAKEEGYISSNRDGGAGSDDIYSFKQLAPLCDVAVTVQVLNDYTNEPIAGARVDVLDAQDNVIATKTTDSNGNATVILECEKENQILAFMENFDSNGITLNTQREETQEATIKLQPIEAIIADNMVELDPILFDFDKHNIKPKAALELDNLVSLMKKYPTMVIKVESHTDNRGSNEYNMDLSNRRAQATVQYVISKDIDKSRISGEGFGKSKPIEKCSGNCTEEQYAKNRRSEFIIVEK